jgi:hypothetical protein
MPVAGSMPIAGNGWVVVVVLLPCPISHVEVVGGPVLAPVNSDTDVRNEVLAKAGTRADQGDLSVRYFFEDAEIAVRNRVVGE